MRIALQRSKQTILQQKLQQMKEHSPASDILRTLKCFIGPTNPNKQRRGTLPMIYNKEGQPCSLPNEALEMWIDFFGDMEGGIRVTEQQLREQWIQDMQTFSQQHMQLNMTEIPTLTDMELAMRRVPPNKARGPDGIPGEICRFHPEVLAPASFAQMLKVLIHGQEPLAFKGGLLTPAYKGKGAMHDVSAFRSLLISSHLGKVVHRCIRQHKADAYEHFLQAQQLGGRRKTPVQLALHQSRAFLRRARGMRHSVGLLFLDLTQAFYRILRELTLGGQPTDELLCYVFHKLQLPSDAMSRLHELLQEGTALEKANLSFTARNCFRAIHSNTHFWLAGQDDVVATRLGSRPGDSFADIIFGFTWGLVLKKLQTFLEEQNLITMMPAPLKPPFFKQEPEIASMKPYVGPTWMDDLCLCLQHEDGVGLERALGPAIGYLLDLCESHLMTPNLGHGKTELMLCFNGAGSRKLRVKHYGPVADGHFNVICEHQTKKILLVKSYRHLGGKIHHTGDQANEVSQKLAVGHNAFNQHRRLLYHNQAIQEAKKVELFTSLVLSKTLYGADSWIANDNRTMKKFEAGIFRMYRRLMKVKPDAPVQDAEVLTVTGLPSPVILLRRARLRYLAVLFRCGVPDLWHLLGEDEAWVQVIEEDLLWMWEQLKRSTSLQDPRHHIEQWYDLLSHHTNYWKRLINRACVHDNMQLKKEHMVIQFHQRVCERLHEHCDHHLGEQEWEDTAMEESSSTEVYGCMHCRQRFRNKAGEAAHMYKRHKQQSFYRCLFDTTQCTACMTEYHSYSRMKAHLYHSARCRRILLSRPERFHGTQGAGSQRDNELLHRHDRLLPPLRAEGPLSQVQGPREFHDIDDDMHIFLVDFVVEQGPMGMHENDLRESLQRYFAQHAISWTKAKRTMQFFMEHFGEDDAKEFGIALQYMQNMFQRLCQADTWSFLQHQLKAQRRVQTVHHYHHACVQLAQLLEQTYLPAVPRPYGRQRIILHAFAGRRRLGDIQYYLEKQHSEESPYTLTVVSLDIIINATWGNAMRAETRALWINAIRERYVVAYIAGPPCETWSRVRGVDATNQQGHAGDRWHRPPRVLRDAEDLWGFICLGLRELQQIITGNGLLCFSLEALLEVALAGSVGLVEHPAEPTDLPEAASIWRLPILRVFEHLPGVCRLRFAQGLLGSRTSKPTELLCVNLPSMLRFLHMYRIRKELPAGQAVGRDERGGWNTTSLKEYPPAFCRAIAEAIRSVLDECEVPDESILVPPNFVELCRSMQAHEYGTFIGHDFAD